MASCVQDFSGDDDDWDDDFTLANIRIIDQFERNAAENNDDSGSSSSSDSDGEFEDADKEPLSSVKNAHNDRRWVHISANVAKTPTTAAEKLRIWVLMRNRWM